MNKIIVFILVASSVLLSGTAHVPNNDESMTLIPDEAIRLRILANSDGDEDQQIKRAVRDNVTDYITDLVQSIETISDARKTVEGSLPELEQIINRTLQEENINDSFSVTYDKSVSFPLKVYDRFVYPAGQYEAILITIGAGKGANWWCVLFPPLCFIDFANGTTVAQAEDDAEISHQSEESNTEEKDDEESVEVKFFLLEWLGLS